VTAITWTVDIDWDNDGAMEAGEHEGSLLQGLKVMRGRFNYVRPGGEGFERQEPGTATITLNNADGRFDPYNASGPLYGYLKPGRRVEVKATIGASTYWLFHGWVDDIVPTGAVTDRKVRIVCKDGWRWLRDRKPVKQVQTNILTSAAIGYILDQADWPAAMGRSLDTNCERLPYWWTENVDAHEGIHDLVESELGRVFVAANGNLVFVNRQADYNGSSAFSLTNVDLFDASVPRPWEVLRNIIKTTSHAVRALTGVEIWRLTDIPLIPLGSSLALYANFTSYDGLPLAATAITTPVAWTPPVKGTTPAAYDYRANTAEDESGTDCTPAISLAVTRYPTRQAMFVGDAQLQHRIIVHLAGHQKS